MQQTPGQVVVCICNTLLVWKLIARLQAAGHSAVAQPCGQLQDAVPEDICAMPISPIRESLKK